MSRPRVPETPDPLSDKDLDAARLFLKACNGHFENARIRATRAMLLVLLRDSGWCVTVAAKKAGITRANMYQRLKRYGI